MEIVIPIHKYSASIDWNMGTIFVHIHVCALYAYAYKLETLGHRTYMHIYIYICLYCTCMFNICMFAVSSAMSLYQQDSAMSVLLSTYMHACMQRILQRHWDTEHACVYIYIYMFACVYTQNTENTCVSICIHLYAEAFVRSMLSNLVDIVLDCIFVSVAKYPNEIELSKLREFSCLVLYFSVCELSFYDSVQWS